MPSCVPYSRAFSVLAGVTAALAIAGAAHAGDGSVKPPNFKFADGLVGFSLASKGGPINPGILVGFNPQPDPPGDVDFISLLDLTDPTHPTVHAPMTADGAYRFEFFHTLADGSVRMIDAPNSDGFTGFRDVFNGHDVNVTFHFGPGQVDPGSWVGFNPQPDPPGDGVAYDFKFFGAPAATGLSAFGFSPEADVSRNAVVTFSVAVDGDLLSFALTPEPSTWAMMILGFGGAGAMLRRRRGEVLVAA
jgi:hypothetical protein